MRSVSLATLVISLALATSMAFAQGYPTPQPSAGTGYYAPAQPPAGAGPCPTAQPPCPPAAPPCPPAQPPCPPAAPPCPPAGAGPCAVPSQVGLGPCPGLTPSIQAGLGAGPVLAGLCGCDFDRAYITSMYQLHTNISALATQGIEQATDGNLKSLSNKIRNEQTQQNVALASMYQSMGLGKIPVDYSLVQNAVNTLTAYNGPNFDAQYALVMAALLGQARDAGMLTQTQAADPRLRSQGAIVVRSSADEIAALQRWITTGGGVSGGGFGAGGYTSPGGYVAPGGTVPIY